MIPSPALLDELAPLLEAMCEDRLAPEGLARLERLVLDSPEARWYYLCYIDLHGSLYWDAAGVGSSTALSSDEIPVIITPQLTTPVVPPSNVELRPAATDSKQSRSKNRFARWRVGLPLAASLCLAMIWWFVGPRNPQHEVARNDETPSQIITDHGTNSGQPDKGSPSDPGSSGGIDTHAIAQRETGQPTKILPQDSMANKRQATVSVPELDKGIARQPDSLAVVNQPSAAAQESPWATVPPPTETPRVQIDSQTVVAAIDAHLEQGWNDAGIRPSAVADDSEWLRRTSLDLVGRIPSISEVEAFLADKRPNKRQNRVDELLDDSEFARNLTTIWTNLLIGRRTSPQVNRVALQKFLRLAFAQNRPWNRIVYDLVSAEGNNAENGATNFLIAHLNNDALPATAVTARVFLGQHVQCNQCHNNPFEKSQQVAFWEMHSFFSQTASVPRHARDPRTGRDRYTHTELVTRDAGGPVFFETNNGLMRVAYPRYEGQEVDATADTNRRAELARLMTAGDRPQLAKAFVNRLWHHLFGAGFTPVVDDVGPHVAVSHPELLDLLSHRFIQSGYDIKQLVRWMCQSKAYQLTSRFNDTNGDDEPVEGQTPLFSRMYVKAMSPEQMYDSFLTATKAHRAGGVDWVQAEQQRQEWLSQFVVNYGTDENEEATCMEGTMSQALTLMSGPMIDKALELSPGTFLNEVVTRKGDEREKIRQLCLAVLSRSPSPSELSAMRKLLHEEPPRGTSKSVPRTAHQGGVNPADRYQDLMWALLNSNEFSLVH